MMGENLLNQGLQDESHLSTLHQTLMAQAIHQDSLLWSRVQILIAIQGGVLTAGYLLRELWIGPAVMFGGAVLTVLLNILILWDQRDRDVNKPLMDELARRLVPYHIGMKIKLPDPDGLRVRFSQRWQGLRKILPGRALMWIVIIGFELLDIALACGYIWLPWMFPSM